MGFQRALEGGISGAWKSVKMFSQEGLTECDGESRIENWVKESQEGKGRWSSGTGGKVVEEANHKKWRDKFKSNLGSFRSRI